MHFDALFLPFTFAMKKKWNKKGGKKKGEKKGKDERKYKKPIKKKGKIIVIYDLNLFFLLSSFVYFGSFQRKKKKFLNEQNTKACTSCYGFFVTLQVSKGNKRSKRKKKTEKKGKGTKSEWRMLMCTWPSPAPAISTVFSKAQDVCEITQFTSTSCMSWVFCESSYQESIHSWGSLLLPFDCSCCSWKHTMLKKGKDKTTIN